MLGGRRWRQVARDRWEASWLSGYPIFLGHLHCSRRSWSSLGTTASTRGAFRASEAKAYGEAVLRAEVSGIVTLRNCFNSELDYDDFVEHHIIRPDASEPHLPSFVGNTVLSGMWRRNEYQPDEDEPESGEGLQNRISQKNTTDPTRLTMDRALRTYAGLRSLGLRRK